MACIIACSSSEMKKIYKCHFQVFTNIQSPKDIIS